jgi:hypothetical protein
MFTIGFLEFIENFIEKYSRALIQFTDVKLRQFRFLTQYYLILCLISNYT